MITYEMITDYYDNYKTDGLKEYLLSDEVECSDITKLCKLDYDILKELVECYLYDPNKYACHDMRNSSFQKGFYNLNKIALTYPYLKNEHKQLIYFHIHERCFDTDYNLLHWYYEYCLENKCKHDYYKQYQNFLDMNSKVIDKHPWQYYQECIVGIASGMYHMSTFKVLFEMNDESDVTKLILRNNNNILRYAVYENRYEIVEYLLKHIPLITKDVDILIRSMQYYKDNESIRLLKDKYNNIDVIKYCKIHNINYKELTWFKI